MFRNLVVLLGASWLCSAAAQAQEVEWIRQFGSLGESNDQAFAVATDGNVYVAGSAGSLLDDDSLRGGFVRKYDSEGREIWTRQLPVSVSASIIALAVEGPVLYAAGNTLFTLPGHTSAGSYDAFVIAYDLDGNELWTRQFGSTGPDFVSAIAVDPLGFKVYLAGATQGTIGASSTGGTDGFLAAFDPSGRHLWTRQFGTDGLDRTEAVSASLTKIFVGGSTTGAFPGHTNAGQADAYLATFGSSGNLTEAQQFGTGDGDEIRGLQVNFHDSESLYAVGYTNGCLPGQVHSGLTDAFVRKYGVSSAGALSEAWTQQFGTETIDLAFGVASDATGVYVGGRTSGELPGYENAGDRDVFVRKYDPSGAEAWTRQFGTPGQDESFDLASDGSFVHVAGVVEGALPGQSNPFGGRNAFLRVYNPNGVEVWTPQFAAPGPALDLSSAVAIDDALYVAGRVEGVMPGETRAGGLDAVVRSLDRDGGEQWTRQFGTSGHDVATAVAVDPSGLYVAGRVSGALPGQTRVGSTDAFVRKYNLFGSEVWTRQFGASSFTEAGGLAAGGTGVVVGGTTIGALPDGGEGGAFVRKLEPNGDPIWTRQFGEPGAIWLNAVAHDATGEYVVGRAIALPDQSPLGHYDAFVRLYDGDGDEIWTAQFGTADRDEALDVAVDATGIYIVGSTDGTFPGQTALGRTDAFAAAYDFSGNPVWARQFGTSEHDFATGVAVDERGIFVSRYSLLGDAFLTVFDFDGNLMASRAIATPGAEQSSGIDIGSDGLYLLGHTTGVFPGERSAGGFDIFLAKIVLAPQDLLEAVLDEIAALPAAEETIVEITGEIKSAVGFLDAADAAVALRTKFNFRSNAMKQLRTAVRELVSLSDAETEVIQSAIADAARSVVEASRDSALEASGNVDQIHQAERRIQDAMAAMASGEYKTALHLLYNAMIHLRNAV